MTTELRKILYFLLCFVTTFTTLQAQYIDLSAVSEAKIIENKVTNQKPDSLGFISSDLLILPKFESGIYYLPIVQKHAIGNRFLGVDFKNLAHLRSNLTSLNAEQPYKNIDMGSMICLKINDSSYMGILAMAGETAFSTFTLGDEGFRLDAGTFGTSNFSGILPKLTYAFGETPHEACLIAWKTALTSKALVSKTALRSEKEYPEYFNYLGYCTWEHLRRNLNTETLTSIMKDMEAAEVPVRWMLIDDGYESIEDKHLLDYQPDKTKFPNGLAPLVNLKSDSGVRWIGQWWHMAGYFGGIAKNNTIVALDNHLFELSPNFMLPKMDQESTDIFYEGRAQEMSQSGIDFIKVDFQTQMFQLYKGQSNAIQAVSYNHRALEKAWQSNFDGLLNCISQYHLTVFKHEKSAVIRSSIDYHKNDENNSYIAVQNLRNSIYLGMTHWLDHDLFISNYHTGKSGTEIRAISGSPLYVSESIKDVDFEIVKPAVWSDGEILRPLAPGTLTPEVFFENPQNTGIRAVAPLEGKVATFWLANFHSESELELKLSPDDYKYGGTMIQPYEGLWSQPEEGLVAYDFHTGKAWEMNKNYSTKLEKWETKIIHLIPISDGWAVIGRPDKYLSPASCQVVKKSPDEIVLRLKEAGPFLVWNDNGMPEAAHTSVTKMSKNLYKIVPQTDAKEYSITINKE
jgi:hypothetical protein